MSARARRSAFARDVARVAVASAVASLAAWAVNRLAFGFGLYTLWYLCELVFEACFTVGLYVFCRSLPAVVAFQFAGVVTFLTLNSLKLRLRSTPLLPSDFLLYREFVGIVSGAELAAVGLALVLVAGLGAFALARFGRRPTRAEALWTLPALLIVGMIGIAPGAYTGFFDATITADNLGVAFLIRRKEETIGAPFAMSIEVARFLESAIRTPNEAQVRESVAALAEGAHPAPATAAAKPTATGAHPNIYLFLVETFWDPSWAVTPELRDSVLAPDFKLLWAEQGAHHMYVPMFGGGTANTEFELLCGIPSKAVGRGIVFQAALSNSVPCLPKLLEQQGYRSFAFHPYDPGYYNRTMAFNLIGFEHFFSIADFSPVNELLPDEEVVQKTLTMARENADGKPFLAYLMTFAGHWPFRWLERAYRHDISVPGADESPYLAELDRHLNINLHVSQVLADAARRIHADDPNAIVVIAGDHLAGLAQQLVFGSKSTSEDLDESRFYGTPLLMMAGGKDFAPHQRLAAYEVANQILMEAGVPEENRAHLPLFARRDPDTMVRPIAGGGTILVPRDGPERLCTRSMKTPECNVISKWLADTRNVAIDLVQGKQLTYQVSPAFSVRSPASGRE